MTKGTAGKSVNGASMSKYDVEVEGRLQALEKVSHPVPTGATQQKVDDRLTALEIAVADIKSLCEQNSSSSGGGDAESKLDKLVAVLRQTPSLGLDQYDG